MLRLFTYKMVILLSKCIVRFDDTVHIEQMLPIIKTTPPELEISYK